MPFIVLFCTHVPQIETRCFGKMEILRLQCVMDAQWSYLIMPLMITHKLLRGGGAWGNGEGVERVKSVSTTNHRSWWTKGFTRKQHLDE